MRKFKYKKVSVFVCETPPRHFHGYLYGIRHSDENHWDPQTVESVVVHNRWGFLIAERQFSLGKNGISKLTTYHKKKFQMSMTEGCP